MDWLELREIKPKMEEAYCSLWFLANKDEFA